MSGPGETTERPARPPVRRRSGGRGRRLALVGAYVGGAVAYVLLCLRLPVQFNSFADKDDAYFIGAARSMLDGSWLGDYTHMTLIKGPGFAYFLAANHWAGTSITLTLALTFVVACVVFVRVVGRFLRLPEPALLALFVVLLFQSALMPSRVLRDNLYHSLFLLVLAGMIAVAMGDGRRGRLWRAFLWGIPLGLFWITREEGIWVVPAFVVLMGARAWQQRRSGVRSLLGFGAALAMLGVGAALPVVGTSAVNRSEYGTFAVTDISSGPFQATMRALDSISGGPQIPRVPVSQQALRRAYAVSPSLAELQDNLGDPDNFWLGPGCDEYPETCGEYAGGWFAWAVRDAVYEAGHHGSAREATRYYEKVSAELADACSGGELSCSSGLLPIGPIVTGDTLRKLPGTMARAARLTIYGPDAVPPVLTVVGTPEQVRQNAAFLGHPRITSSVAGVPVDAPENGHGWLRVRDALTQVYAVVSPVALVLGLLSFAGAIGSLLARGAVARRALVVAGVAWVLYASRLALMALIDITSSPALISEYLEPAFLALWVAAFLSVAAVAPAVRARFGRPAGRPA